MCGSPRCLQTPLRARSTAGSCLQTPTPVHGNAHGHREPSGNTLGSLQHNECGHMQHDTCLVALTPFAMEGPAMPSASCAKDVVPLAEAVLETTAGYKAVPPSLLVIPLAATLSGHAASLLPSSVLCQHATVMTQPTLISSSSRWPNPAAVLKATMQSTAWQKQQQLQQGQQYAVLAMQVSPDAIGRSSEWLQLQRQQLRP